MKYKKSALTKQEKRTVMNSHPSKTLAEIQAKTHIEAYPHRLQNAFTWLPNHERPPIFPWLPKPYYPNKELRKPLFWLSGGSSCWFVNNSSETLTYVGALSGGFASVDDEAPITVSSSQFRYYYEQVLPNEAVLVEELDIIFDSDFMMQITIEIDSPTFGKLKMRSEIGKGSIPETIFIWDSGEYAKYAQIKVL
jgi:hypothetical protein